MDLARGNLQGRRGWPEFDGGGGARAGRGRGKRTGEEKDRPRDAPGRGLYAPAAGSPDALYVAPDASGDHRTHAQRGLHFSFAPDDGHRTLALASGASGHTR